MATVNDTFDTSEALQLELDDDPLSRAEHLISIGISLSAEKNTNRLLENILIEAQNLTRSDGGTLYMLSDDDRLSFEIMRTRSLGIAKGGSTHQAVQLSPISLYDNNGIPNNTTIAASVALTGESVNIQDVYSNHRFDFSGTKKYDQKIGYHSMSFLTIPMKNHENRTIGVLQLINAIDEETGKPTTFTEEDQRLAESLASMAAVALTNHDLLEDLRELLEKFIEVIAGAIDEKSPYTGGHCRRVPEIAMLLADAVHHTSEGMFADLRFSDEQMYELRIAAMMHDCGKITTPIHVVDKATKLETINDRIHLVEGRFAILKREAEISALHLIHEAASDKKSTAIRSDYQSLLSKLDEELEFLRKCNFGSEYMAEDAQQRVKDIAKRRYRDHQGNEQPLLSEEEVHNLTIAKGTLNPEERKVINYHINSTITMLENLPFPKHLRNVPEIAGGHHETMDGKGYPRGLKREDMSVQARIMGIADIFEALTAADRPYKKAMPISVALKILNDMKNNSHIDPDIFEVFIKQEVYKTYAKKFLNKEQLDNCDIEKLFNE